jgi:hypothetical protein
MRLVVVIMLLVTLTSPGVRCQTQGHPFCNDLFIDLGAIGALAGPPNGVACGMLPPSSVPPSLPFTFNVTSSAPGHYVILAFSFGNACTPGAFFLPPLGCGTNTSHSVDLNLGPGFEMQIPGFEGVTMPAPGGGLWHSVPIASPGMSFPISIQAAILDPSLPLGLVMTNAVTVLF